MTATPVYDPKTLYKNISAIGAGNILEWYDFAIFGALADAIAYHFFPLRRKLALIASLSVFGSAFFMRPLGGLLMGYIGDTYGRKRALECSIAMMVIPSFLMGCLPTYQQWGMVATIMLVILRLTQGLAVGGEMVGAFIFTIETTQGCNRGYWGGVVKASGLFGSVLGMSFVAFLREILSEEDLYSYGWRVPFLTSLLMGVVGLVLRFYINESEEFTEAVKLQKQSSSPLVAVTLSHFPEIMLVIGVTAFWCVGYYTCFVWMGYYTSELIGDPPVEHAWLLNIIMTGALILIMPLGGMLGDFACSYFKEVDNGYRRVMMLAVGITVVFGAPAFELINYKHTYTVLLGQFIFAVSLGCYGANLPAFIVQQFSVQYRYSGVGIAYNISNAMFAGTAPLIQTAIVIWSKKIAKATSGSIETILPAIYLCSVALFSICVLFWAPPLIEQRKIQKEKDLYHAERRQESRRSNSNAFVDNNQHPPTFWQSIFGGAPQGANIDDSSRSVAPMLGERSTVEHNLELSQHVKYDNA